jgi:hypothetical protein
MTIMTGIKDGEYLAQFLGKKIAIKENDTVSIYQRLEAVFARGDVFVTCSKGITYKFKWDQCENPYMVLTDPTIQWEMK